MNTAYLKYLKDTVTLARSLIIKSNTFAHAMNEDLLAKGEIIDDDPFTWRYYHHLNGQYHSHDQTMSIKSHDTQLWIPFTKEKLIHHPATKRAYAVDGPLYQRLVSTYPEQELLIRGILQPVDKEQAIHASDFSILDYNKDLVEKNESNLIPKLQEAILLFQNRWDNTGYQVTDDLYPIAQWGILILHCVNTLFYIRLSNCKTPYVHSYHVREFLESHGRLGEFVPYLTLRQRLFLYRNLLYIERHVGQKRIFEALVKELLTARQVGLAEFTFYQDYKHLPTLLHPELDFKLKALNPYHYPLRSAHHTFLNLLEKQRPVAPGNIDVEEATLIDDTPRFKASYYSTLPTKSLESSMIDWSGNGIMTREEYLMYHWIHSVMNDKYNTFITFKDPHTQTSRSLTVKNALYLWYYSANKMRGVTLNKGPTLGTHWIRRYPTPDLNEIKNIIPKDPHLYQWIKDYVKQDYLFPSLANTWAFNQWVNKEYELLSHLILYYLKDPHPRISGYKEGAIRHLYDYKEYTLPIPNYDQWLKDHQWPIHLWSTEDYETLTYRLFQTATGEDLNFTYSIADKQRAMLRLIDRLTSYSIHFIQNINQDPLIYWQWRSTRLVVYSHKGQAKDQWSLLTPIEGKTQFKGYTKIPFKTKSLVYYPQVKSYHKLWYDAHVKLIQKARVTHHIRLRLPKVRFQIHSSIEH